MAEEYFRIERILQSIRLQTQSDQPDQRSLDEDASALKTLALGLRQWLRDRLDAGADGFMKAIGFAAAAALAGLYEELVQLYQVLLHWITLIG